MIWEIHEAEQQIEGLDAAGRPDPAYAAALGLLPAPFGRRAVAALCDGAIWLLLQLPLWLGTIPLLLKLANGSISTYGFLNHPDFVFAVVMAAITTALTLVIVIVQWALHGRKGLTIGKAIVGIRTVNVRTLERPGLGAVLLRFCIVVAAGVIPFLGPALFLLSPTFDPERRGRGWHDQATRVWSIDVARGLNPFDEKRMRVARKVVKADPAPQRSALPSLATPVDPSAQPAYQPGDRISAGVLGVARPHRAQERSDAGTGQPPSAAPAPAEPGKPVLGGYRNADDLRAPLAPPAALAHPVPPEQQAAPQPQAVQPAPQGIPQPPPQAVAQPPLTRAAARQAPPAALFGLRLDNGDGIQISSPILLGRNPDAADHPGARAIALADDSRSLSKTHLLVRPVDGGLEVMDCRSTNGSGLIRDGVEYTIAAGVPVIAADGDTIRLGDRTAVVVRV